MNFIENEKTEQIYTPDVKKEVIAFANTYGGIIYIGVRDSGEIVGITISCPAIMSILFKGK